MKRTKLEDIITDQILIEALMKVVAVDEFILSRTSDVISAEVGKILIAGRQVGSSTIQISFKQKIGIHIMAFLPFLIEEMDKHKLINKKDYQTCFYCGEKHPFDGFVQQAIRCKSVHNVTIVNQELEQERLIRIAARKKKVNLSLAYAISFNEASANRERGKAKHIY